MNLEKLLKDKKSAVLKRWLELISETYPEEASRFLKSKKNQFANPVGYTLSQEIEHIFDALIQGQDPGIFRPFLDNIIRIRAVQDFTASQAVVFIFLLKMTIRESLEKEIREKTIGEELLAFESQIDHLALLSFDIFMKCREKIYELKSSEVSRRTYRLLQRANLVVETPPDLPSIP
jgi:RsbT co-antagonist protein rsbRD N-terminal domain